jgi:hypothetical protein
MKDILIQARAKIADQDNWTQHVLARDINDNDKPASHPLARYVHWEGLDGRDPQACKFCALGAVQAATPDENEFLKARDALNRAASELFGTYSIAEVNDDYDHAAVLQCYDRAINEEAS